MKVLAIKGASIMMGIGQAEYLTVPLRAGSDRITREDGSEVDIPNMTAAFRPTEEELERLNAGASIHMTILGSCWAPMRLLVQDAPFDPEHPDDAEMPEQDAMGHTLEPGQFVVGMQAGQLAVTDRSERCVLRRGDILVSVDGSMALDVPKFNVLVQRVLENEAPWVWIKFVRGGRLMRAQVPMRAGDHEMHDRQPEDLGPAGDTEDAAGAVLN